MNERASGWASEWVSERVNKRANEWVSERASERVNKQAAKQRVRGDCCREPLTVIVAVHDELLHLELLLALVQHLLPVVAHLQQQARLGQFSATSPSPSPSPSPPPPPPPPGFRYIWRPPLPISYFQQHVRLGRPAFCNTTIAITTTTTTTTTTTRVLLHMASTTFWSCRGSPTFNSTLDLASFCNITIAITITIITTTITTGFLL